MMKQVDSNESVGKTIQQIELDDNNAIILFEDKTFLRLQSELDYDGQYAHMQEGEKVTLDFKLDDVYSGILLELGIATQEEIQKRNIANKKHSEEQAEKCDRNQYEELKKRFENV